MLVRWSEHLAHIETWEEVAFVEEWTFRLTIGDWESYPKETTLAETETNEKRKEAGVESTAQQYQIDT